MRSDFESFKLLTPINSSAALTFGLPRRYVSVMCIPEKKLQCRGIFYGDNPFKFVAPVFVAQMALASFLTSFCHFFLQPFGQTSFVGQILGGIIAGPTFLGQNEAYRNIMFPAKGMRVLETLSLFGCMLFLFLVGVRMDVAILKRSGSREWTIGILTYILPQLLSISISFLLHYYSDDVSDVDTHVKLVDRDLPFVAVLTSMTSFHVISCILHELRLFSSELGRIAGSASMISGMLCWGTLIVAFTVKYFLINGIGMVTCVKQLASLLVTVIFLVVAVRPLLIWMIRQTPEGKPMKEGFIMAVFLLLFVCCFFSQLIGQSPYFVPMVFGLVTPDGPPLGSTVVEKMDCIVSYLLLPLYFVVTGDQVQASGINAGAWFSVITVFSIATFGKFIGTMLPCLYYQMPFRESLSLALILSSVGLVDVQSYSLAQQLDYINNSSFSIMSMTAPIMSGIISFTVKALYDPSRRYVCYRRRTIEQMNRHSELRILVCVNNQENVPAIINVLEASNPTRESPMGVYVLNLFELMGRASPLLVAHRPSRGKRKGLFNRSHSHSRPNQTERIINAFRIFESNKQGIVYVQPYTCIAPYTTMHDDICTLALDKYTSLLILPFHKFWSSEGVLVDSAGQRNVNKHVLAKSPCSVGILVDGGVYGKPRSILESWSFYRIAVIFFCGADDREALSYAIRMADHPNVKLTVVRLVDEAKYGSGTPTTTTIDDGGYSIENKMDDNLINEVRIMVMGSNRVSYVEEAVTDSLAIINVIQSMNDSYELILAGRRHKNGSYIFRGLKESAMFPELGHIGDMLVTNVFNSTVSVLVVQQQQKQ